MVLIVFYCYSKKLMFYAKFMEKKTRQWAINKSAVRYDYRGTFYKINYILQKNKLKFNTMNLFLYSIANVKLKKGVFKSFFLKEFFYRRGYLAGGRSNRTGGYLTGGRSNSLA